LTNCREEAQKTQKTKQENMQDIMQLCDTVRETAFAIHRYHEDGLLMNFGAPRFEIRKYALSHNSDAGPSRKLTDT
jgi:hypothetical protein